VFCTIVDSWWDRAVFFDTCCVFLVGVSASHTV
jgi:hypothetical protein